MELFCRMVLPPPMISGTDGFPWKLFSEMFLAAILQDILLCLMNTPLRLQLFCRTFVAILKKVFYRMFKKFRKIYMKKHLQWKPPLQIFSIAGVLLWVLRKICRTVFFRTPVDGCFGQRNLVIRRIQNPIKHPEQRVQRKSKRLTFFRKTLHLRCLTLF